MPPPQRRHRTRTQRSGTRTRHAEWQCQLLFTSSMAEQLVGQGEAATSILASTNEYEHEYRCAEYEQE